MVGEVENEIRFNKDYEQCCFYDMSMTLNSGAIRDGSLFMDIRCKCMYCDTEEESYSTHREYRKKETDSWRFLRKMYDCKCGLPACTKCCCARIRGTVFLKGTEFKEVKAILKSGNWGGLKSLIDGWIDRPLSLGSSVNKTGDKNCDPPIPDGWNSLADRPWNFMELNCCR
jgi:hypothetical protein